MRSCLAALISVVWLASPAEARPTVLWLSTEVPEEAVLKRASRSLDTESQDLAFPSLQWRYSPASEDDQADYERLTEQLLEARSRWNEYEVELGIAERIGSALRLIDVVRDEADRRELVAANLVMGAAIEMGLSDEEFPIAARAQPYRVTMTGVPLNRGFVQASVIDPDRTVGRNDLVDGSRIVDYAQFSETWSQIPDGSIDLSGVPGGAVAVLDGTPVAEGTSEVFARPGQHRFHVLIDGKIHGRMRIDVEPRKVSTLPVPVSLDEMVAVRAALLSGAEPAISAELRASLNALAEDGELYLGATDGSRVELLPWADTAGRDNAGLVTMLMVGDVGGSLLQTPVFEGSGGASEGVPGASAGLGFELGISHALLLFGSDVAYTPGRVIVYGNRDETANEATSVLPMPYGGLGAYVVRPRGRNATLSLAGTYGWQGPAHWGLGGRVSLGIPTGEVSWVRMTLGGTRAGASTWDEALGRNLPMTTLWARLGIAARL